MFGRQWEFECGYGLCERDANGQRNNAWTLLFIDNGDYRTGNGHVDRLPYDYEFDPTPDR